VRVIPTNEEAMIASHTLAVVQRPAAVAGVPARSF